MESAKGSGKITATFWRIPKSLQRTLSQNNGKELTRFRGVEKDMGIAVYFAGPYAVLQRGTNKNTNSQQQRCYTKGLGNWTLYEVFQEIKYGAIAM